MLSIVFSQTCCLPSLLQAQQLTELEKKLAVAKNELEKAALDRVSCYPGAIMTRLSDIQCVLAAACGRPEQF